MIGDEVKVNKIPYIIVPETQPESCQGCDLLYRICNDQCVLAESIGCRESKGILKEKVLKISNIIDSVCNEDICPYYNTVNCKDNLCILNKINNKSEYNNDGEIFSVLLYKDISGPGWIPMSVFKRVPDTEKLNEMLLPYGYGELVSNKIVSELLNNKRVIVSDSNRICSEQYFIAYSNIKGILNVRLSVLNSDEIIIELNDYK